MRRLGLAAACVLYLSCGHARWKAAPCGRFAPAASLVSWDRETDAAVRRAGAQYGVCPWSLRAADGKPLPGSRAYLVTREGARAATLDELREIAGALFPRGPEVLDVGAGSCELCPVAPSSLCARVTLRAGALAPAVVAERLVAAAARVGEGVGAHVVVELVAPPGPRCAASDPACGPVHYLTECPVAAAELPVEQRRVVSGAGAAGQCRYDGECVVGGCGNDCLPASAVPLPGTCQLDTHWQDVYCGCVRTACAWFEKR